VYNRMLSWYNDTVRPRTPISWCLIHINPFMKRSRRTMVPRQETLSGHLLLILTSSSIVEWLIQGGLFHKNVLLNAIECLCEYVDDDGGDTVVGICTTVPTPSIHRSRNVGKLAQSMSLSIPYGNTEERIRRPPLLYLASRSRDCV